MTEEILLILFLAMVSFHVSAAFLTLGRVVHYRTIFVNLDADRIAHQPFQPKISLVVRGDLAKTDGVVARIQEYLSLNYTRYEVILIADAARQPEEFGWLADYFDLQPAALPAEAEGLAFPVRGLYRSAQRVFGRLTVVDKAFDEADDLRQTGTAIARADYMLFVRSLNNELIHNSLARLAILKMRDPQARISRIRGTARYDCGNRFKGNVFRSLTDLCNLRRQYVSGSIPRNDYGQFLMLEQTSARRGREEFVPRPQMFLYRPNHLRTYLEQLAPRTRYKSARGKAIFGMELLHSLLFWAIGLHLILAPGVLRIDVLLLIAVAMLPLLAATFSVFVGEVLLKETPRVRRIVRLLLLAFPEAVLFCLGMFPGWIVNQLSNLIRRRSAG